MAIERAPFGSTGHRSSRVIFGAVALSGATPAESEATLAVVLEHGINHIDTASSYGDSEDQLRPWLAEHRDRFFLATKTGERTAAGARESIHRSLERLGVGRVDLIQLHNRSGREARSRRRSRPATRGSSASSGSPGTG
jgi:aryl-alcohol dehydrogenase-like predicted oxidoreductase